MTDSGTSDAAPALSEGELRYLLWWQILRPDRLKIAEEIGRAARRYRRVDADAEADALDAVAAWVRASAGEVSDEPEMPLDAFRKLMGVADSSPSVTSEADA